jgi:hypothetical protein
MKLAQMAGIDSGSGANEYDSRGLGLAIWAKAELAKIQKVKERVR